MGAFPAIPDGSQKALTRYKRDVYNMAMTAASRHSETISPPGEAAQDVVYRLLKQRVLTLPAQEGAFLTEAEICRAMGTSRTPVREALLRLESEGLLQIVPKKGAYVAPITEAEVAAVMQARGLVEEWCARFAALGNEGLPG